MELSERGLDISKESVERLKEVVGRYDALLKNKTILDNLHDKGESVKVARDKILKELKMREDMKALESSFANFSINESYSDVLKEKYTRHVCQMDKPFEDKRYKPHKTLTHVKEKEPGDSEKTVVDINAALEPKSIHESTKLIPLAESLAIQKEQFEKAKEDRARQFLIGFIKEDEVKQPEVDIESVALNPDNPEEFEVLPDAT